MPIMVLRNDIECNWCTTGCEHRLTSSFAVSDQTIKEVMSQDGRSCTVRSKPNRRGSTSTNVGAAVHARSPLRGV